VLQPIGNGTSTALLGGAATVLAAVFGILGAAVRASIERRREFLAAQRTVARELGRNANTIDDALVGVLSPSGLVERSYRATEVLLATKAPRVWRKIDTAYSVMSGLSEQLGNPDFEANWITLRNSLSSLQHELLAFQPRFRGWLS
jgi:hypothetical protein